MTDEARSGGTLSGLTEREARAFHGVFMTSFIGFTILAIVAHILVWMWRPWFPGVEGYASVVETVTPLVQYLS